MKGVEYNECRDIDFFFAKSIERKLDNKIKSTGKMESASTARTPFKITKPTQKEADKLLNHCTNVVSDLFYRSSPYPDEFVPKPVMQPSQTILTELRDEDTK